VLVLAGTLVFILVQFKMKKLLFENGDLIPTLGLGTWKSKPGEVFDAVIAAITMGYRHIDCAPIYGNEKEIGAAFKKCFDTNIVKREELWVTSKLWNDQHKEEDVIPALKKTLSDLQLNYLDLFLIHWPVVLKKGLYRPDDANGFVSLDEVPIAETWKGMEAAYESGLAKHIGVSNFSIKKLKDLMALSVVKPEMNQIEMHPYLSQPKMVSFCKEHNIHLTAYSPLGSFDRSPKMKANDEPMLMNDLIIAEIAREHNCSSAQVLIAWAIQRGTAVIPKSVNPARMKQNLEATKITLAQSAIERIEKLNRNYRFIDGTFWTVKDGPYTIANLWDE
jgi:alcohol dehydrogenase (NADP+)